MCGIAGLIDFEGAGSRQLLEEMTDAIRHRGPDASGYYFSRESEYSIGLGHRRLSIIDLSPAGNQPMQYLGDRYRIIFNGEIYNYSEIRNGLIQAGHEFHSTSDTEVILHAFHEWGCAAVNRFIGMFAFVIYDSEESKLYCFRDRAGVKPFYYSWNEKQFLFGSELKSLMKHPAFKKEIDPEALGSYLQFGYVPAPHSIFLQTKKLLPGHYLILDLRSKGLVIEKYWDVYDAYNKPKLKIGEQEAIKETERVLEKAFNYRMVADVPVGVFLSGGYDSVTLTTLLQKERTDKLKTFTIGFEDPSIDEAPYARAISSRLGTDHHELYCTEKDALEIVEDLPFFYDEPLADNSSIPTILVSRLARQTVTVALSADAGDEIFGGYIRYPMMQDYYRKFNSVPGWIRQPVAGLMKSIPAEAWPGLSSNHQFSRRYEKIQTVLGQPVPLEVFLSLTENYSRRERARLMLNPAYATDVAHYREGLEPAHFDALSYAMARDYQTYMVDDILQKVDRATMSVSLEGREPFLDQHIIEWVARLPNDLKIREGERKYLLHKILHQYIPREMMDRPKMGFVIPVKKWLEGPLKPVADHYLGEEFIRKQGLFSLPYVKAIQKSFYDRGKENNYKVWFLLMFQLWYQRWMMND